MRLIKKLENPFSKIVFVDPKYSDECTMVRHIPYGVIHSFGFRCRSVKKLSAGNM